MAEQQTITIEVDGQSLEARAGQMLIEVTDAAGITVPRFCYHKHLSISANCRMCLVEVEKAPKPLPACATPCMDGMKVFTKSPLAREAQKGTMEFLLINHPLDCPICDQGGECELQDMAVGYGGDVSRFSERKRVVADPDIGPLVSTDMTRCIHCTRCVRFGDEVAGLRELGATGRGEHTKIGTYVAHAMTSELSGNVIDLCPVGALTSKPFRFHARAWEMTQHDGIAPHDSVGSNIHLHVRRGEVLRVVPKENDKVNESWISDRDRFSYEALGHADRLTVPMIKESGRWREVEWEEALNKAASVLSAMKTMPERLGALVSPSATLEEIFLAQKLVRGLGSNNIDHRLRMTDFRSAGSEPQVPWLGVSLDELEQVDAALLVGSNVRKEQPLINHRLRRAAISGAKVMAVNPVDFSFNYDLAEVSVHAPSGMVDGLAAVAKAAGVANPLIDSASVSDTDQQIADNLKAAGNGILLLGNIAASHPDFTLLRAIAVELAQATGCKIGYLPEAANSVGAWLAGGVPHRGVGAKPLENAGDNVAQMFAETRATSLVVGVEAEWDCIQGRAAMDALDEAGEVISLSCWRTPAMERVATVMLPIGAFAETSGTYVNAQGDRQSFAGVVAPPGDARPAWKVLRVLGNLLNLEGFDYDSSDSVRDAVFADCEATLVAPLTGSASDSEKRLNVEGLERIATVAPYGIDGLTRRSEALHKSADGRFGVVLSAATAARYDLAEGYSVKISQNGGATVSSVIIDDGVPDNCVWFSSGVNGGAEIGGEFGEVSLEKLS